MPNTEDKSRPDPFQTRLRRARAWCGRAEAERPAGDLDVAFLSYWIAFNAAYAHDLPLDFAEKRRAETTDFGTFLRRLVSRPGGSAIHDAVSGAHLWPDVDSLLEDKYLYLPFWDNAHDKSKARYWRSSLNRNAHRARSALWRRDTDITLTILFQRIYTLRNQVAHGGARWNSEYNRETMKKAVRVLESLVPLFITVMANNPRAEWGTPHYRVYPIYWPDTT